MFFFFFLSWKVSVARPSSKDIKNSKLYVTNLPDHFSQDQVVEVFQQVCFVLVHYLQFSVRDTICVFRTQVLVSSQFCCTCNNIWYFCAYFVLQSDIFSIFGKVYVSMVSIFSAIFFAGTTTNFKVVLHWHSLRHHRRKLSPFSFAPARNRWDDLTVTPGTWYTSTFFLV